MTVSFIALIGAAQAAGGADAAAPPASARLLADVSAAAPGSTFRVGVLFNIAPSWHIYWKNSGDSGMPTMVRFAACGPARFSELRWPAPMAFRDGEQTTYGYEQQVLLWATASVPVDAHVGSTLTISADCEWLVCRRECISGEAKLALSLPVRDAPEPAGGELFDRWAACVPVEAGSSRSPVQISLNSLPADGGGAARFRIAGRWKGPAGHDVAVCPDAGELFSVENVSIKMAKDGFEARLSAKAMRGREKEATGLPVVVSYADDKGIRRGVYVTLPMQRNH